ncbi:AAA ATPase (modular protein) [Acidithiobacillus ferrivorans]|uniref:AAA ATPase (Modular protein) n=1 Tax=Acidithiobacillus ferrivorans TaxID=160808 RepID=A0A060UZL2_9PROT|nr:AAA family ATPase [Acidithiobacillus ferrivorans]CDQ12083.1 AAA ATPase (modular protein) [Acidithiobacillus ferrivorans]SMH64790.1 AAA ATPase (modular protein) [Acidithiobacillus ferrivorans]
MDGDLKEITEGKSDGECAIICASRLEKTLESVYGASGPGLGQKASAVAKRLPAGMDDKLRRIAGIRNSAAHDPLEFSLRNRPAFVAECSRLLDVLAGEGVKRESHQPSSASSVLFAWEGFASKVIIALALAGNGILWFHLFANEKTAAIKPTLHVVGLSLLLTVIGIFFAMLTAAAMRFLGQSDKSMMWHAFHKGGRIHVLLGLFVAYMVFSWYVSAAMVMGLFAMLSVHSVYVATPLSAFAVTLLLLMHGRWTQVATSWRSVLTLVPLVTLIAYAVQIYMKGILNDMMLPLAGIVLALSPLAYITLSERWKSVGDFFYGLSLFGGAGASSVVLMPHMLMGSASAVKALQSMEIMVPVLLVTAAGLFVTSFLFSLPFRQKFAKAQSGAQGSAVTADPEFVEQFARQKSAMDFSRIAGMTAMKDKLLTAAKEAKSGGRNGILLYGEPGNGKTLFAEALAGEIGLPLVKVSIAQIKSRWVGETTQKLMGAFAFAKQKPCVLFFDEIEAIVPPRDRISDPSSEDAKITAAFLTALDDLRATTKVVILAATNYLDRVDPAGIREGRFDWKIEIPAPDQAARRHILSSGLRHETVGLSVLDAAAKRLRGYTAAKIRAVSEEVARSTDSGQELTLESFIRAQKALAGSSGHGVGEDAPGLDDLVLQESVRVHLRSLMGRMLDPVGAQEKGATVPSGVIFYGDPGNGKTMAARALAKESGWSFLNVTGADVAKEDGVKNLLKRANEIRPCIVFLDEADGVLANRDSWQAKADTINGLLTAMDGSGGRMSDILWVAATNRIEAIDPAMLRGGRFSEKIRFPNPDAELLASAVQVWLAALKLPITCTVQEVAGVLSGLSFASAREAIQSAVNHVVGTDGETLAVADIVRAKGLIEIE